MKDPLLYPKLRWPIDIRMETHGGQEILLIACPLGITPQPLLLKPFIGPLIAKFEGTLSIDEIASSFAEFGVQRELVARIAALLDENLFLASPKFFSAEQEMKDAFGRSAVRPSALAGLSYPSDPSRLNEEIDRYLAKGSPAKRTANDIVMLSSPHIDYRRGGECYGSTYARLRGADHTVYLVLGTSHQYSTHLFHLTRKDFALPTGVLSTEKEFVDGIIRLHGVRGFNDEYLHRREHSLELQLPFLQRVVESRSIVPILVGSFHHMLRSGKLPHEYDEYESFVGALTEQLRSYRASGRKVCVITGVDMAHVGQFFGDSGRLTPEFMERIAERDGLYLAALCRRDRIGLFTHVEEDMDARRICGFPTMYTVLDVLERLGIAYEAEVFDYRQAVNYENDCAVTFAGLGFYE